MQMQSGQMPGVEIVDDSPQMGFLSEEQSEELAAKIEQELLEIEAERAELLQRREDWRLLLSGRPNEDLIDVRERPTQQPFTNSARTVVPMITMLAQTMYAQLMGSFNRKPLWTTSAQQSDTPEHFEQAKLLTKYKNMLAEGAQDLNMERVKQDAFMESPTMGTAFYKVIYNREVIHYQRQQLEQEVVVHDGPQILVVDYEHLWFRDGWRTLQEVPFLAQLIPMSVEMFKQRVAQGWYGEEEKVLGHVRKVPTKDEQTRARAESRAEHGKSTVDLYEVYMYYDVDGDGQLEDLKLFYHRPTGCIVRAGYNDFGIRPFVAAPHVHRPNRITGIGICEMLEYPQKEANSLHNMFLDNVKLANSAIVTRKNAAMNKEKDMHVNAGGPTIWDVEEHDDIRVFRFGQIYPSLMQAEERLFQYAMRLVGINEAMAGFPSMQLGSRDTAMGQQQRLTQGASILSTIARSHEEAMSEVGRMVYMRLVQNKELVLAAEATRARLTGQELALLDQALTVPDGELPMRAIFRVRTTTADQTTEGKRQNMFAINTMYQQYTQSVLQLLSSLFGPESRMLLQSAPELYMKLGELFIGTTRLMKENFEFFDKTNEEEYLPDTTRLEENLRQVKEALSAIPSAVAGPGGPAQLEGANQGLPAATDREPMPGPSGQSLLEDS